MDRLSLVGAALAVSVLAGGLACNDKREAAAAPSRYESVKAVAPGKTAAARWCDSEFSGSAPRLSLPPLAANVPGPAPLALASKGKRVWLNLWATWCGPCLREMPLLLKWQRDLRADGVDVDLVFLSMDDDVQAFGTFLAGHKELAAVKVVRVASQSAYEAWVKAFLKDPSTPIPIHFLASADGNVRCIRSGSLREGDYPAAKAALR
jgi:thiol-disulfide isomerase/thioredoxin